jgi:hypothetical protein
MLTSLETPTWWKHYRKLCNQSTTVRCDALTGWELFCGTASETFNWIFILWQVLSGTSVCLFVTLKQYGLYSVLRRLPP